MTVPRAWGVCSVAMVLTLVLLPRVPSTLPATMASKAQWDRDRPVSSSVASASEGVELVGQIGGVSYAVAVQGSYAYLGVGLRLVVLDISNPEEPLVLGRTEVLSYLVEAVAVAGGYAYFADSGNGLRVIDVGDPVAPVQVGYCDIQGRASGVAVAGGYAYIASGDLRVIDVTDPAAPVEVGYYHTPGSARNVAVDSSHAYVADGSRGLRVIDVENPTHPKKLVY